tara:strand:+ start:102 stop:353 length:252 start_codon:yes stop_codon:yes gene_type:complete
MEMSEKKKKVDEKKEQEEQMEMMAQRNANLTQTAQNLADQLNKNMVLISQYEGTIGAMTTRLQEKDNIIRQLQMQLQQLQGGE